MIYLDSAATSLLKPPEVGRAVIRAMGSMASPGRGSHAPAMAAAEELLLCREAAAGLFNVPEIENVVFTMNASHALNIAIKSLAHRGSRVLISGYEHNSVLRPLIACGAGIRVCGRRLFDSGRLLDEFSRNLSWAELAVCTHVSNVFGWILPVYELAELCRKRGVPLIIDASQSAGVLELDMKRLGAAFIAMPGHKGLFGPQGTGLLLCGQRGRPLIEGGSGSDSESKYMPSYLPDRLEAGTHNVCGIAGLRAGIEYVRRTGTERIKAHEDMLLERLERRLSGSSYELFSGSSGCRCSLISLRYPGLLPETISERLSEEDICCRCGLHCAPLAHKSAGTLSTGTVRLSFSPFISPEEADAACDRLLEIV